MVTPTLMFVSKSHTITNHRAINNIIYTEQKKPADMHRTSVKHWLFLRNKPSARLLQYPAQYTPIARQSRSLRRAAPSQHPIITTLLAPSRQAAPSAAKIKDECFWPAPRRVRVGDVHDAIRQSSVGDKRSPSRCFAGSIKLDRPTARRG